MWDACVWLKTGDCLAAAEFMAAPCRDLAEEREDLRRLLAEHKEALRAARRASHALDEQDVRAALAPLDRLGPETLTICLSVLVISGDPVAAQKYAEFHFKSGCFGDMETAFTPEALMAKLVAAQARPRIAGPAADPDHPLHFRAARFYAEWCTFQWLAAHNYKGVAPPSTAVRDQYRNSFPEGSQTRHAREHLNGLSMEVARFKTWVRGYRRRWRSAYRKLPAGTVLTDPQIQSKACPALPCPGVHLLGRFVVQFGPGFGPIRGQFWAQIWTSSGTSFGPFLGSFLDQFWGSIWTDSGGSFGPVPGVVLERFWH